MKILNFRNLSAAVILLLSVFTIIRVFACTDCIPWYFDEAWAFYTGLVLAYLGISVTMAFFPSSGFHYPMVISGGSRKVKSISLSFDDGPDAALSPGILDVLKKHKVRAGFFLIGKKINGNEALVKRIYEEGHIIGNHSYSHTNLWDLMSSGKMASEIEKTGSEIKAVTGKTIRYFRPPFGVINPMVAKAVKKTGMTVVTWRFRSFDTTASSSEALLGKALKKVTPGDILLFHDSCLLTAGILEKLIVSLQARGFAFVPLDELINLPAYE
ncbi:MAG: polysaccharide deacetylase family protein [Bacteroidota bacterium]